MVTDKRIKHANAKMNVSVKLNISNIEYKMRIKS